MQICRGIQGGGATNTVEHVPALRSVYEQYAGPAPDGQRAADVEDEDRIRIAFSIEGQRLTGRQTCGRVVVIDTSLQGLAAQVLTSQITAEETGRDAR